MFHLKFNKNIKVVIIMAKVHDKVRRITDTKAWDRDQIPRIGIDGKSHLDHNQIFGNHQDEMLKFWDQRSTRRLII